MHATGAAVLDLVAFADDKASNGGMAKNHFVSPSGQTVTRFLNGLLARGDSAAEGTSKPLDPEHRPPSGVWQTVGNGLRTIPRVLGSEESTMGFRAACAVLSVGILAYIPATQEFFVENRLVWAMIMIAICMTMSESHDCLAVSGEALTGVGTQLLASRYSASSSVSLALSSA